MNTGKSTAREKATSWLRRAFLLAALVLLNCIAAPALAQNVAVSFTADKPVYSLTEKATVTVIVDNQSGRRIGPLRIVFRMYDSRGRVIAYKNLYPGTQLPGQKTYSITLNTDRLRLTSGLYKAEALVFQRGQQLATGEGFLAFARKVEPASVIPVLHLDAPFAINAQGVFSSEALLDQARPGSLTMQVLDRLRQGKMPCVIAVSCSFLYQLEKMSDGYVVQLESTTATRDNDSEQARLAAGLIRALKEAASQPGVTIAFAPFADVNPIDIREAGLDARTRDFVTMGQDLAARVLDLDPAPSLVYLPRAGIDEGAVRTLADMGFSVLVDTTSTTSTPFLSENVTIYPVVSVHTPADGSSAMRGEALFNALLERQIASPEKRSYALSIDELDPIAIDRFLAKTATASPVRVAPLKELVLSPGTLFERKPDYGVYDRLVRDLLARFKETARLLDAFDSALADEENRVKELREELFVALMPAFSSAQDFNSAFRRYHNLEASVKNAFAAIVVEDTRVDFPTRSGKLPLTIKNEGSSVFKVVVHLSSSGLTFQKTDIPVTLSSKATVFTVPVTVTRTGAIPVTMEIRTPDGFLVTKSRVLVNSTFAYRLYSALLVVATLLGVLFFIRRRMRSRVRAS